MPLDSPKRVPEPRETIPLLTLNPSADLTTILESTETVEESMSNLAVPRIERVPLCRVKVEELNNRP